MSVYGLVILSVALTVIGVLLEGFITAQFAVIGILALLGNTFLLGLIFIPKVCLFVNLSLGAY